MYCSKCGAAVQDKYKFCMKCGAAIDWKQPVEPMNTVINDDQNTPVQNTMPKKKKPLDKSKIIGLVILGVLLIVLFVMIANVLNPNSAPFRPSGMTDETFRLGNEALTIITDYNNGKISKSSAVERVETIKKNLDSLSKKLTSPGSSYCLYISIDIDTFTWHVTSGQSTLDDEKGLRKTLGYAQ